MRESRLLALLVLLGACRFEPSLSEDRGSYIDPRDPDAGLDGDAELEDGFEPLDTGPGEDAGELDLGSADLGPGDGAPADEGTLDAEPTDGPFNQPPLAAPLVLETNANTDLEMDLPASDPDGDNLSLSLTSTPARGVVVDLGGLRVRYSPPPDRAGEGGFDYRVDDGRGGSAMATVMVRIVDTRDCWHILSTGTSTITGVYRVDPDGTGLASERNVWCENDANLDGGGWMLVARSVVGAPRAADFGWLSDRGSIGNDASAYCIDVERVGFLFNQVLITSYSSQKIVELAYRFEYDGDFYADCRTAGCRFDRGDAVVNCSGGGGSLPTSLRYLGHLSEVSHQFMDNAATLGPTGLFADGFELPGTDCTTGGDLDGRQGMIWVRCRGTSCDLPPW